MYKLPIQFFKTTQIYVYKNSQATLITFFTRSQMKN